jgi:N-carbamoylputrescine amidase
MIKLKDILKEINDEFEDEFDVSSLNSIKDITDIVKDDMVKVAQEQYDAWQTIQRSHAVANGLYVVSVNRVGIEANQKFWGGSFIANPHGRLLYLASHENEETHVETLDLDKTEYYRTTWPYLRDRRIDTYEPILKRFID